MICTPLQAAMAKDLRAFSRHGKRSTVTNDDVKLLARYMYSKRYIHTILNNCHQLLVMPVCTAFSVFSVYSICVCICNTQTSSVSEIVCLSIH
jgi:CENP-S protein